MEGPGCRIDPPRPAIHRQTEELEADRVLWYRRRQEIEQELEQQRAAAGLTGMRKADLDGKGSELRG